MADFCRIGAEIRVGAMFLDPKLPKDPKYELCQYEGIKLDFRGPKRNLSGEFVAFLGSTETFGKYVETPFPDRLQKLIGTVCVNLGCRNISVDGLLNEPGVTDIASRAKLTVLQVPCATGINNKYYHVHPRRNDRFLNAKEPLTALFPKVDFTEFNFTRHMLSELKNKSESKFARITEELTKRWIVRMKRLLGRIDSPVLLLWFSGRCPEEEFEHPEIRFQPSLVRRDMIDELQQHASAFFEFDTASGMRANNVDHALIDKVFARLSKRVFLDVPGQSAHDRAAKELAPVIVKLLQDKAKGPRKGGPLHT
ncbi:MAG: DUF6473 family protein [Pseudomonadota bacterium]